MQGHDLSSLRGTIADADAHFHRLRQQGHRDVPHQSLLYDRICYRDDENEGRSPLCYAVALCKVNVQIGADSAMSEHDLKMMMPT